MLLRLQRKLMKNIKFFLKKRKKKSNNMAIWAVDFTKISQKTKNKSLLNIRKIIIEKKEMPSYNYKILAILEKNDVERFFTEKFY